MKPINKNKSRSIEITIISITIPLLMVLSFQAGMLVRESIQLISEPVSEISIEINRQADTHGGLAFETIEATITAYTSSPEETNGDPCISASGVDLCEHYPPDFFNGVSIGGCSFGGYGLMACPKKYPFGTKIVLDELGSEIDVDGEDYDYICVDRLSDKHPDRFDIYMGKDKQKAMEWGIRTLKIKIYE